MSHSLIEPSDAEIEVVRRAQQEMMAGEDWGAIENALVKRFLVVDDIPVTSENHYTIDGDGAPASIAYLHSIVARGLGDSYNYTDSTFVVEIRPEDRIRCPTLTGVRAVTLRYRGATPEIPRAL